MNNNSDVEAQAELGINQSAAAVGEEWVTAALSVIRRHLRQNPTFFVDDIWDDLPPQPKGHESKRALGQAVRQAGRRWMHKAPAPAEYGADAIICRPSKSSRGAPKAVWISDLYYQQQQETR